MAYLPYVALMIVFQLSTTGTNVASATSEALFVFGDSYGDTGNHRNGSATAPNEYRPWRTPYGLTWPASPSGRYSDGRVFTDLYSTYLGVDHPTPYAKVNGNITRNTSVGINFAFGGSGVFPTKSFCPNVSTQIAQLQGIINNGLASQELINASIVLITINGNDYTQYLDDGGSFEGLTTFVAEVSQQLRLDIESLYGLGFKTLAISNLAPVGCLPTASKSNNYTSCVATYNGLVTYHNSLLASNIVDLQTSLSDARFIPLDFNQAFENILQGLSNGTRSELRSCCDGINDDVSCGDVDEDGAALYTVCPSPSEAFFWDDFHPTDTAWQAISNAILPSQLEDHFKPMAATAR